MSRNPRFDAVLARIHDTHEKKNSDYADDSNPYSNFEGAAHLAGQTVDQVFHTLLGIKMERLRQLMTGKKPNYESLDDTLLDLATYAALWLSYRTPVNKTENVKPRSASTLPEVPIWFDDLTLGPDVQWIEFLV